MIILAVRWYLRFGLSYRHLEELLAERGIDADHVTLFRWVWVPNGHPPSNPAGFRASTWIGTVDYL